MIAAISSGESDGYWSLSKPDEFECPYGFKKQGYFLVLKTFEKTGMRFFAFKKGSVNLKSNKIFCNNATGTLLDEAEWWALVRNISTIQMQLAIKRKKKTFVPESEMKFIQGMWNFKDECYLCTHLRSETGLPAKTKGARQCLLCKRFFPTKK